MNHQLILAFPGTPRAVQSFRYTRAGRRYQPGEVVEWKNYLKLEATRQLPQDFRILEGPVAVTVDFFFPPPASWSKKKLAALHDGALLYKTTKPDLTDNLMKGMIDALSGIVWRADQQICRVNSRKLFGETARTVLAVYEIE